MNNIGAFGGIGIDIPQPSNYDVQVYWKYFFT